MKLITPKENQFSFTMDIVKSLTTEGDSPKMIIKGVATNTRVDKQGDSFSIEGLESLKKAIENGIVDEDGEWSHVPLLSGHRREWDDHLGWVTKAEIDEDENLWITAELDEDSSTARDLYRKIARGTAKLGLSVRGRVTKYSMEFNREVKKAFPRFHNLLIKEISVTGKPVNPPPYPLAIVKSLLADPEYQQALEETMEIEKSDTIEHPQTGNQSTEERHDEIAHAFDAVQTPEAQAEANDNEPNEQQDVPAGYVTQPTVSEPQQEASSQVATDAETSDAVAELRTAVDSLTQGFADLRAAIEALQVPRDAQKSEIEEPENSEQPETPSDTNLDERIGIAVAKAFESLGLTSLVNDIAVVKSSIAELSEQPADRSISVKKAKDDTDPNDPLVRYRSLQNSGNDPIKAAFLAGYERQLEKR